MTTKITVLSAGGTFTEDATSTALTVHMLGCGGDGFGSATSGQKKGGGSNAAVGATFTPSPGRAWTCTVPAHGGAAKTRATIAGNTLDLQADFGVSATSAAVGTGGQSANNVVTGALSTLYSNSGASGGNSVSSGGGGGAGAAGPDGVGRAGGASTGTAGGGGGGSDGNLSTVGVAASSSAVNGGDGTDGTGHGVAPGGNATAGKGGGGASNTSTNAGGAGSQLDKWTDNSGGANNGLTFGPGGGGGASATGTGGAAGGFGGGGSGGATKGNGTGGLIVFIETITPIFPLKRLPYLSYMRL